MELVSYAGAAAVMLIVGFFLRELKQKWGLVWWNFHQFIFELDFDPPVKLLIYAITVHNVARTPARDIEIIHNTRPDYFKLEPALDYVDYVKPSGDHVLCVKSLGSKEFVTVQFLNHVTSAQLRTIKSEAGPAREIDILTQRVYRSWWSGFPALIFVITAGALTYWLVKIGIHILGS